MSSSQQNGSASATSVGSGQQSSATDASSIGGLPSTLRHSFDMKYYSEAGAEGATAAASMMSPAANPILATPPKLQQSYSTNDIPTVKNSGGVAGLANNHAQQYLQNHNASLGRIPAGAMPHRHSRELSTDNNMAREAAAAYHSISSTLQANAVPFGPMSAQVSITAGPTTPIASPPAPSNPSPYVGYYNAHNAYNMAPANAPSPYAANIPLLSQGMQGLAIGGSAYPPQNYTGYGSVYGGQTPVRDSQARVIQSRRQMDNEGTSRFVPAREPLPPGG